MGAQASVFKAHVRAVILKLFGSFFLIVGAESLTNPLSVPIFVQPDAKYAIRTFLLGS
jgi:hypothetical protein